MIKHLITNSNTISLSAVLGEAYLSSGPQLLQDLEFRKKVLERIAIAPYNNHCFLEKFLPEDVAPVANRCVGTMQDYSGINESFVWLVYHLESLDIAHQAEHLQKWKMINQTQRTELSYLLYRYGSDELLEKLATNIDMYTTLEPTFVTDIKYSYQAETALMGLADRHGISLGGSGLDKVSLQILRTLTICDNFSFEFITIYLKRFIDKIKNQLPHGKQNWEEFASLSRRLALQLSKSKQGPSLEKDGAIDALNSWACTLEQAIATRKNRQ